jgi:hypothetical protein
MVNSRGDPMGKVLRFRRDFLVPALPVGDGRDADPRELSRNIVAADRIEHLFD